MAMYRKIICSKLMSLTYFNRSNHDNHGIWNIFELLRRKKTTKSETWNSWEEIWGFQAPTKMGMGEFIEEFQWFKGEMGGFTRELTTRKAPWFYHEQEKHQKKMGMDGFREISVMKLEGGEVNHRIWIEFTIN